MSIAGLKKRDNAKLGRPMPLSLGDCYNFGVFAASITNQLARVPATLVALEEI